MQTLQFYSESKKGIETINFDTLDGINTGICYNRIQQNKPCFFVSFSAIHSGKIEYHYEYFAFRFTAENLHQKLLKAKKAHELIGQK